MAPRTRHRDRRGRFTKRPPLTAQQLGDAGALVLVEEREPAHVLERRAVYLSYNRSRGAR